MPFEGYKFKFELRAAHSNVKGDKEHRHFHTFTITLYLRDMDQQINLYEEIEEKVNQWFTGYQNRYLDETELFQDKAATLEEMGDIFYDRLKDVTEELGFELLKLDICESPVRTYSVSDRILDAQANELTVLPYILRPEIGSGQTGNGEEVLDVLEITEFPEEGKEPGNFGQRQNTKGKPMRSAMAGMLSASGILLCLAVIFAGAALVMYLVADSGVYPRGSDTFCHLYRADLILENLRAGNWYPLYDPMWYNGVEIMRYWGPVPLYLLALLQFIGGSITRGYVLFLGCMFCLGGAGWLLFGKRYRCIPLALFMAFIWFFLPENISVLILEGNLPRALIHNLLPYLLFFLWRYLEEKKVRHMAAFVLLFSLIGLCHIGSALMVAAVVIIFTAIDCKAEKRKGFLAVLAGIVTALALIGIWMVPSLIGGAAGRNSSNNQVMELSFHNIFTSLNPMHHIRGDLYTFYYGLSVFIICVLGILFGTRTTLPGFMTSLIIFLCTAKSMYPIFSSLPFSQYLWISRLISISFALFVMAMLLWKRLKKSFVLLMCVMLAADCISSYQYLCVKPSEKVADVEAAQEERGQALLLDRAKEITTQRLTVYDLSSFAAFVPYYVAGTGKKTAYMFGAGWEGATTAQKIVRANTAVENGCYTYVFDRSLEMGNDTVIFAIHVLQNKAEDIEKTETAGRALGYELVAQNGQCLLFKKEVEGTFGTVTEYKNLAIGRAACDVAMLFPDFKEGDSDNLDDYSLEELCSYEKIYLSDVKYAKTEQAEEKLLEVAASGVRIYIDMNRLPADSRTNNQEIFGVSTQSIHFQDAFPALNYDGKVYKTGLFVEEYSEWSTVYLSGLERITGYGTVGEQQLPFAGYGDNENIMFLGYNLVYHGESAQDDTAIALLEEIFQEKQDTLPLRQVVPVDISFETNKIVINTESDYVNTALAYLDIFSGRQELIAANHLVVVRQGETVIELHYPYLTRGAAVSALGAAAFMVLLIVLKRRHSG